MIGAVCALTSAAVWGGGDFCGGLATRRSSQYQVLALAAFSGLVALVVCAAIRREALPGPAGLGWAFLAGLVGGLGLASLYRGLSIGQAAVVAPTSGVLGAALPVVTGLVAHGAPTPTRLAGFGLALLGIWLVSGATAQGQSFSTRGFPLACLAGLGFGGYFVLITQVERGLVFTPLIVARSVELAVGLVMVRATGLPFPSPRSNPIALLAGVLDASGSALFVLASQFVRVDVAAVLTSLYPASTVLLSVVLLKQKMSAGQGLGLVTCLLAIGLITA